MRNHFFFIAISALLAACSSPNEGAKEFKNLSYQEGLKIYQQRCAVCHGEKGEGLKALYPPIAGSDYMLKNKELLPCIIKNGLEGEIEVNGIRYNSRMLPLADLSEMQVADLMTFLLNSWEMNEGAFTKDDVKKLLETCNK